MLEYRIIEGVNFMARKRIITPEKKGLIGKLILEYNIKTVKNLQQALEDLLGDTIQSMLEAELDEYLDMKVPIN